jgi:glutamate synthase (ferredoxin)
MSGGIAYVLDEAGDFASRCNMELVAIGKLADADEIEQVWKLVQRHQTYTRSERAAKILGDWKNFVPKFVKVLPKDYARVLEKLKEAEQKGLSGDDAVMAAFEANIKDVARVGGG